MNNQELVINLSKALFWCYLSLIILNLIKAYRGQIPTWWEAQWPLAVLCIENFISSKS